MSSIVGVRLTRQMEKAVKDIMSEERVDKSTAIRALVDIGYAEWRLRRALQLLREGKVSAWKAAKVARMNLWDFLQVLKKENIEWVEFEPTEGILSRP